MARPVAGPFRSLVILAAGIVLGGLLVAPVAGAAVPGAASPAALQTRAVSCSGFDFHPIDSETTYGYKGVRLYRPVGSAGSGFFTCNPLLPHGAVVTKVQFTVTDNYPAPTVRYCGLVRVDLRKPTAGHYQSLADLPETDTTGNGDSVYRLSTSSISNATIDNTRYAYWLQCQLNGSGDLGGGDERVGLVGAAVTYRISAANG